VSLQLVAIAGPLQGKSWPIGATTLVIGRDRDCHVHLHEPLASRRHCQLVPQDGALRLEDLGARNPVLVNGQPCRSRSIGVGDTLSFGEERFLVAQGTEHGTRENKTHGSEYTLSLRDALSMRWDNRKQGRGKAELATAQDLVFLFETCHALAACPTFHRVLKNLVKQLKSRFHPDALWVVQPPRGKGKIRFYDLSQENPEDAVFPSADFIHSVLESGQSALTQQRSKGAKTGGWFSSMVAPLCVSSLPLGALVLQRGPLSSAYEEHDIGFLDISAQAVAPILHSADVIDRLEQENIRLRRNAGESVELVGESSVMQGVRDLLDEAAQSDLNVLVRGETGTGKELAARILHTQSLRSEGPFVVVNCAAIPEELFESQVFGHLAGAFTGATSSFDGLFAQADTGTLFLDEVGDLSPQNQARILRAVELGTFRRIGAHEETAVDVRIVTASNLDLEERMAKGAFRQDLLHRLNGFEITLPPLHERPGDVTFLARHFFELAKDKAHRPLEGISPEALQALERYPWPGNVRELRNCVLRAISVAKTDALDVDAFHLSEASQNSLDESALDLDALEKKHIIRVLKQHDGNVRSAAETLGIARSTLYKKMSAHEITV
jgi:DNA-binding NtrC family response regulator